MKEETRRFALLATAFFLTVAAAVYLPVFWGAIPFPAAVVTNFPAYENIVPQKDWVKIDIGDVATLFYPWRVFQASIVRQGDIPEWNPHILGGTPFIASVQSAVFYPLNFLYYFLPVPAGWAIKLYLNVFLAGFLTALFARSLGANTAGALCAGVVYALCGFMTVWQAYTIGDTAVWLPALCYATHHLYLSPSIRTAAITALAYGLPQLAGHPETSLHITLAGCLFFLWLLTFGKWDSALAIRRLASFATAGALAAGIAAVQLIPTLSWTAFISRTTEMQWGVVKGSDLLAFFSRDISATPNSSNLMTPETAAYAGMATLLLAGFAVLHRSLREAVFFMVLLVLCLEISVGLNPGDWLATHTPVMQGVKNWRLLGVADFALAMLAGLGLTSLTEHGAAGARRLGTVLAVVCTAGLYAIWVLAKRQNFDVSFLEGPFASALLLMIAAGLIVIMLRRQHGVLNPHRCAAALVIVLTFDMVSFAYGFMGFARTQELYPSAPVFDFLQSQNPQQLRVVNTDSYVPNAEMVFGLSTIGGYEIALRNIKQLLEDLTLDELDTVTPDLARIAAAADRRVDMLSAKFIVTSIYKDTSQFETQPERFRLAFSEGTIRVFENLRALPRAYLVPATAEAMEVIREPEERIRRLRDPQFDPARSVLLDRMPSSLRKAHGAYSEVSGSVSRVEWMPDTYRMRVTAPQLSILVFNEAHYPGWRAFIDDVPAEVFVVNHAILGIAVPEGAYDIRFEFRQPHLRSAGAVSAICLLFLVGILALGSSYGAGLAAAGEERSTLVDYYHTTIAPRNPLSGGLTAALALGVAVAIAIPRPAEGPPQLLLDKTQVIAGQDSYVVRVPQWRYTTVDIRYTLNGSEPQIFQAKLDSDGEQRFEVAADTPKGVYKFLEFRAQESAEWLPATAVIEVK